MSYLSGLRLTFAGKFQANVSTVNNDAGHYDTGRFKPSYQELQSGKQMNGWFNPEGDGAWRLLGCRVTGAWLPSGPSVGDAVLGHVFADSDARVCAKMADIDPQQQLVSQIWGLAVRVVDALGRTLLGGEFEVTAFMDIWDRATGGGAGGDMNAGAIYQSVLTNLVWGDVASSPVLSALKAAAADGILSIKLNLDGVNADFKAPDFMCGRITGTIGPATATEPRHLVVGRQFVAQAAQGGNFFTPVGQINFFPGRVDAAASALFLDLGNALSTSAPAGPLNDLGDLTVTANGVLLGTIPSQGEGGYAGDPTWYPRTAGVVALPLDAAQLAAVAAAPITLTGAAGVTIAECPTGAFLRADRFVYRMSPGDAATIAVYATQWGAPLAGAAVALALDESMLQAGSMCQPLDCPQPGQPADRAPRFPASAITDANGVAVVPVAAQDPGTPRTFKDGSSIDGQVYGLRPSFADAALEGPAALINQWNFVSFLVWSGFAPPSPVTWDAIQPVLQQYANLYPIMGKFLDLGDYASVVENRRLLTMAFSLDEANPNAMPVTRDLSPAKRAAILAWLAHPLPAAAGAAPPVTAPAAAPAPGRPAALEELTSPRGGKSAAMARRVKVLARASLRATRTRRAPLRIRVARSAVPNATPLDELKAQLQQAVELEHATLPVYLYALYSIDASKNAAIAQIVRSVAIEEMLHMTLACNVLNAVGGAPIIDRPRFVPAYPGHLPGGVESSLTVHLRPFSFEQLETFLDIEQPEDPITFPADGAAAEEGVTIGQFYEALEKQIVAMGGGIFVSPAHNQIGPDQMDNAVVVTDVRSALRALETIVVQGEGTRRTPQEIVGSDYAHFYRFMQIKQGHRLVRVSETGPVDDQYAYTGAAIPFDPAGVYPVPDDPKASRYPVGSQPRALCDRFNYTYTALLRALHATFNGDRGNLDTAIGVMMSLKGQAMDMMTGIPDAAVFTGPSFEYQATDPSPDPPQGKPAT